MKPNPLVRVTPQQALSNLIFQLWDKEVLTFKEIRSILGNEGEAAFWPGLYDRIPRRKKKIRK